MHNMSEDSLNNFSLYTSLYFYAYARPMREEKKFQGLLKVLVVAGFEGYMLLEDGRKKRIPVSRSHSDRRVGECVRLVFI